MWPQVKSSPNLTHREESRAPTMPQQRGLLFLVNFGDKNKLTFIHSQFWLWAAWQGCVCGDRGQVTCQAWRFLCAEGNSLIKRHVVGCWQPTPIAASGWVGQLVKKILMKHHKYLVTIGTCGEDKEGTTRGMLGEVNR